LATAQPGQLLTLEGEEARHAVVVKRLRVAESVLLSDAAGRLIQATVSKAVAGSPVRLEILVNKVDFIPPHDPQLVLVQALAKQRRDEAAVAAATALGVDTIIPWQADHSVARWLGDKAARNQERWRSLALAEAKVARRAWTPLVAPVADSRTLAANLEEEIRAGRARGIVLHEDSREGLVTALGLDAGAGSGPDGIGNGKVTRHVMPPPAPRGAPAPRAVPAPVRGGPMALPIPETIYLVTGPEGGISSAELDAFASVGCHTARLGREVLRAGLAGPAALAVINHLLGRWPW
jgi:16S rRNA (uracil1498-N3)-methyltransferase